MAWITAVVLGGVSTLSAQPIEVEIVATADTSIYQQNPTFSNGAGVNLFAGRIDGPQNRALIRFEDLSAIPEGAAIISAELRLWLNRKPSNAGPVTLYLHRVTSAWGESSSDAGFPGGQGVAARVGDATWSARFHPDTDWIEPGADFVGPVPTSTDDGGASSKLLVNDIGSYTWPDDGSLRAHLLNWLADPDSNFGWILIGRANGQLRVARRFNSRENLQPDRQPTLIVRYEIPLFADGFEG